MGRKAVLIIFIAVAAVVLTVSLIISLTGGLSMFRFSFNFGSRSFGAYTYPDSDLYSRGNAEIYTQGIEKLDISWLSDSVTVETHSGYMISVSEEKSEELNEDEKLCYLVRDGVLYIKFCSPKYEDWKLDKVKRLTVRLPASMGALKECVVCTVSANMYIKDIAADKFKLDSTSGDIQLSPQGKTGSIDAHSTSGSMEISATADSINGGSTSGSVRFSGEAQHIVFHSTSGSVTCGASVQSAALNSTSGSIGFTGKAETLNAGCSSGSIRVNGSFHKVQCSTSSGSIRFEGEVNEIKCSATSGGVSIDSGVCPSKAEVNTTSSQIRLTIPGDKGFTAYYHTISGRFNCDFPVRITDGRAVYGDGSAQFNLTSTSGNIVIKEK